jgi:hypothetical protein
MDFLFSIRQAMVTVDSKEFFIGLNAAQCKIAYLNRSSLAIAEEWSEFVKDETEI